MARGENKRRVLRKDRTGRSPLTVGAVLLVIIAAVTFFGFTKHIPFTHGYRLQAVFTSANSIKPGSPVRIAGVNIGKVKAVRKAGRDAAVVSMELEDRALPIHKDATLRIRPRIFLEGNFFVDLKPGTPSSPALSDNDTVPMTQTSTPVQLDQVLTSLQSDTRQDLQDFLGGYGTALNHQPTAAEDVGQDPAVQGKTGAQALNGAFDYSGQAFRNGAIVNQATLGTQTHDLSKLIRSFGSVASALDSNESDLQGFITNFNTTMAALASQDVNLRATIRELPPTLTNANRTLADLNKAFPPTRAFAREILPGVRETPATINASFPWIAQTRRLLGPTELRGVVQQLSPTAADLGRLTDATIRMLPQFNRIALCLNRVILPTGDVVMQDGALSTGAENYKEFWYTMVGLAGEGQNFDGNGMYVRFQPGGGPFTVSTGKSPSGDKLFGNAVARPLGTRPRYPGKRPPYHPEAPCYRQKPPELNGPAADIGPVESLRGTSSQALSDGRASQAQEAAKPAGSLADQIVARLNPFARSGSGPSKPAEHVPNSSAAPVPAGGEVK